MTSRKKVHHKVKNDLQVMMSMFNLQAHLSDDPKLQKVMTCVSGRVFALALIHQLIYRAEKEGLVDLTEYIRQLGKMKSSTLPSDHASYVVVSDASVYLPEKTATTAGLVINEILDNALMYGCCNSMAVIFPVVVTVSVDDGVITLRFRDTGKGYNPGDNLDDDISMGTTLIKTFTSQLGGSIRYNTGDQISNIDLSLFKDKSLPPLPEKIGTEVVLIFPMTRE